MSQPWWMPELNKAGAVQGIVFAVSGLCAMLAMMLFMSRNNRKAGIGVLLLVASLFLTTYAKVCLR